MTASGPGRLLPEPRSRRLDGGVGQADVRSSPITGVGAGSDAWRLLGADAPEDAPESYSLRLPPGAPPVLAAPDDAGLRRGLAVLAGFAAHDGPVPPQTVRDRPALRRRGIVEGFYGAPWSHEERLAFLRFAGGVGMNEYVYAPKDDPYHRDRWRDPYPEEDLRRIAAVAAAAAAEGVRFVYAISPALTMRFADPDEHRRLAAKAEQLWSTGVRSVALLFDDVPTTLADAADRAAFGDDAAGAGRAHGDACRRFRDGFLLPHGVEDPVVMCPTDYAGCARSPYRDGLAATLPADALVLWTGSDIVVGEVTRADIDAAAAAFGRRLVLWDNFPVNDFDRSRLFLGPLLGRTTDLDGSALVGVLANPMVEAAPSRFALASTADWAWNPAAYDPAASAAVALPLVAGGAAPHLAPLVAACSSWPPGAPQSAPLLRLTEEALDGSAAALDALTETGRALAAADPGEGAGADPALLAALEPWLAAGRDAGGALVLGCALLRDLAAGRPPAGRAAVRAALQSTEGRYANVLRSIVPPFLRAVLARAGEDLPAERPGPLVLLLTGANPAPGDRDLAERLVARGCRVDVRSAWPEQPRPDLVVVTPAADRGAAAAAGASPAPLLAWGRLRTLRLADASRVLLAQEEIDVADPHDPLAAGLSGRVRVHRGPGALTAADPLPGASVVARATTGEPVLVRVPCGTPLTDGSPAPADRIVLFLATDGAAPWLLTAEAHALVAAATDALTEPSALAGRAAEDR